METKFTRSALEQAVQKCDYAFLHALVDMAIESGDLDVAIKAVNLIVDVRLQGKKDDPSERSYFNITSLADGEFDMRGVSHVSATKLASLIGCYSVNWRNHIRQQMPFLSTLEKVIDSFNRNRQESRRFVSIHSVNVCIGDLPPDAENVYALLDSLPTVRSFQVYRGLPWKKPEPSQLERCARFLSEAATRGDDGSPLREFLFGGKEMITLIQGFSDIIRLRRNLTHLSFDIEFLKDEKFAQHWKRFIVENKSALSLRVDVANNGAFPLGNMLFESAPLCLTGLSFECEADIPRTAGTVDWSKLKDLQNLTGLNLVNVSWSFEKVGKLVESLPDGLCVLYIKARGERPLANKAMFTDFGGAFRKRPLLNLRKLFVDLTDHCFSLFLADFAMSQTLHAPEFELCIWTTGNPGDLKKDVAQNERMNEFMTRLRKLAKEASGIPLATLKLETSIDITDQALGLVSDNTCIRTLWFSIPDGFINLTRPLDAARYNTQLSELRITRGLLTGCRSFCSILDRVYANKSMCTFSDMYSEQGVQENDEAPLAFAIRNRKHRAHWAFVTLLTAFSRGIKSIAPAFECSIAPLIPLILIDAGLVSRNERTFEVNTNRMTRFVGTRFFTAERNKSHRLAAKRKK